MAQAQWEPDVKLSIDAPIPLADAVYDLIRDEVTTPLTLSEIRKRIEDKFDAYLAVERPNGFQGYRIGGALRREHDLKFNGEKEHYPTFNAAMKALILGLS